MLDDLGVSSRAVAMIGDDIESDIRDALHAGLHAVLVRTGKYREERVRESGIEPSAVIDSIADLPELMTLAAEPAHPGDPPGAGDLHQ